MYNIVIHCMCRLVVSMYTLLIGWPGKVHDARVLVNSNFYQRAMAGQLPDWKRIINGVEVPLLILGDPA